MKKGVVLLLGASCLILSGCSSSHSTAPQSVQTSTVLVTALPNKAQVGPRGGSLPDSRNFASTPYQLVGANAVVTVFRWDTKIDKSVDSSVSRISQYATQEGQNNFREIIEQLDKSEFQQAKTKEGFETSTAQTDSQILPPSINDNQKFLVTNVSRSIKFQDGTEKKLSNQSIYMSLVRSSSTSPWMIKSASLQSDQKVGN